jgi:hypothetical protein
MKKIFFQITMSTMMAATIISCQSNTKTDESASSDVTATTNTGTSPIAPIVADYLTLKNALVASNVETAAAAGEKLFATLNSVDIKSIPADRYKEYVEIADNARENAEHMKQEKDIAHLREHFASLSKDVSDLIAMFGAPQKLYEDFCPMYNNDKGGMWISETEDIKNPYFGDEMLTCGSVKKVLE